MTSGPDRARINTGWAGPFPEPSVGPPSTTRPAPLARAGLRDAYRRRLRHKPMEASLVAVGAYFATLILTRLVTTMGRAPGTAAEVSIAGVHIHHEVFGILALLVAGVLAIDDVMRLPRAILFGVGAALVLDEFALVVFLKDVYWLPQGLLSVAAIAIGFMALAVNAWRGRELLRDAATEAARRLRCRL